MLSLVLLRTWPLFSVFHFLNKGKEKGRKVSARLSSLSNFKKKKKTALSNFDEYKSSQWLALLHSPKTTHVFNT